MATTPISGPSFSSPAAGAGPIQAVQPAPATTAAPEDASSADDAVQIDLFPSSPPDDVLAAIATASASYDSLAESGLHVSFDSDDADGGLTIALHDESGTVLSSLKPSEVLALADGNAPTTQARTPDVDDQHHELGRD